MEPRESSVAESSPPENSPAASPAFHVWFPAAIVAAAVVGAIAANAPARLKLVGLFAIGLGILSGAVLALVARKWNIPASRQNLLAMALCILVGQGAATAEAYRGYLKFWKDHFQSIPLTGRLTSFTPEELAAMTPESRQVAEQIQQEAVRRRELRTFSEYLRRRLPETMSNWPAPLPWLWWLGEIGLATVAGTFAACRLSRPSAPPSNQNG